MDPMQDKKFDEQLRAKFSSYTPEVPAHLWENIAEKLDEKELASKQVIPLKKKSTSFWWIKVAAAIVAVIGISLFYKSKPQEVIYLTANKKVEQMQASAEVNKLPEKAGVSMVVLQQKESSPQHIELAGADLKSVQTEEQNASGIKEPFTHETIMEEVTGTDVAPKEPVSIMAVPELQQVAVEEALFVQRNELPAKVDAQEPLKGKKKFGVASLLNVVVSSVDQHDEKVISFANDDEGTIKVAVNFKALRMRL